MRFRLPIVLAFLVAACSSAPPGDDQRADALNAARRKAMTISFARAAAMRLHGLYDPEML